MTHRQQLIYSLVAQAHTHPTAEEVLGLARRVLPGIGLATVYRSLDLLVREGLVRRIRINGEPDRFDGTLAPHIHVICRVCGAVRDLFVEDIVAQLVAAAGGHEVSCEINIWETCENCKNKLKGD